MVDKNKDSKVDELIKQGDVNPVSNFSLFQSNPTLQTNFPSEVDRLRKSHPRQVQNISQEMMQEREFNQLKAKDSNLFDVFGQPPLDTSKRAGSPTI